MKTCTTENLQNAYSHPMVISAFAKTFSERTTGKSISVSCATSNDTITTSTTSQANASAMSASMSVIAIDLALVIAIATTAAMRAENEQNTYTAMSSSGFIPGSIINMPTAGN